MVDIHAHILPGIDDGAKNLKESLDMLKKAADYRINHIVASSHGNYYSYTLEEYWNAFYELKEKLKFYEIPVSIYPGMELFVDDYILERLEKKELLSINGTDYLLVEFPFDEYAENVRLQIETLIEKKYRVVLAHPERYLFFQKNPDLAYYLEDKGCIMQINQGSLIGDFGEKCRKLAIQILDDGIVSVIGTDAHDLKYRSYEIRRFMNWISRYYSTKEIHLWTSENPSRILKGYDVIRLLS